ncbi:glycosyltransferase [Rossellomorea sp. NPDC077527]|uniref:CgeB family protein n=1 Tax=Rossellomorea sp. NPDC077527 TaxID=3364510 RepID=UPI0037CAB2B6
MKKNRPLKIVFIGRYSEGSNGIVRSIFMGLNELGHVIHEINVSERPNLLINRYNLKGGNGPIYIKWNLVELEIKMFKPDIILFCAGGLTFEPPIINILKRKCTIVGITLSDPDVFPYTKKYVHLFDYHTTNSMVALKMYKQNGFKNTVLLPFAIDSRFFVPRPVNPSYKSDISIIGHFRANRLQIAQRLLKEFNTKIYGRNWPISSNEPVHGESWFEAAYSTKFLINFPKTGKSFINVKVGVFEAIATGRLLFTEYFSEMEHYYKYGKELIGYKGEDDLINKIQYYLDNPSEAESIAKAGQLRTATEHTWSIRLKKFLDGIQLSPYRKW